MDITLGAELRRIGHLMEIAATMPRSGNVLNI
jgi:hypothetical protein